MAVQTPKCRAKNPFICRDPRCPEKRYNVKYTLQAMKDAKNRIKDLQETNQYIGNEKDEADFAYISAMEWHNELLADSKLSSKEAYAWYEESKNSLEKLMIKEAELKKKLKKATLEEKPEIRKKIDATHEKISDMLLEVKDAEANYHSTWRGQQELEVELASTDDPILKKEIEKQLAEGRALHAKQIIAMKIVDRKRLQSDLPIQVSNVIDLDILPEEEKELYAEWIDAVRFEKNQVSNRELIMNQTFTSIYRRVSDLGTSIEWRIRPRMNHKGWRIPDYVAKALYRMPDSTDRVSLMDFYCDEAYKQLKTSKKVNDVDTPEYHEWAERKYDLDTVKRFIK